MSKRYTRNPGNDQVAKWKAALAAKAAADRRQPYRPRKTTMNVRGVGKVRIPAKRDRGESDGDGDGHHGGDDYPGDHPGLSDHPATATETDKVGRMGRIQDHNYGA